MRFHPSRFADLPKKQAKEKINYKYLLILSIFSILIYFYFDRLKIYKNTKYIRDYHIFHNNTHNMVKMYQYFYLF